MSLFAPRRAPQAVVVPCHSLGSVVAVQVFSYAVCRYAVGVGGVVEEKGAASTSSDQKWRISRDQRLSSRVSVGHTDGGDWEDLRCVTALSSSPCAYAVVCADKVVADQHGIVTVRYSAYHLAIDFRSPVSALVVRAQRL